MLRIIVIALLAYWQLPLYAAAVAASSLAQLLCMRRLVKRPKALAPWYNATGVTLYVSGMMVCAFALRSMAA